ncbi:hypothetical protein LCGC14_0386760 [marine sediment metagenome]|uniref:Phage capsid-like C-terminal domain-containing protein n=1 Tax=marine sediment metagenome TaxID=412755 RepID=A0A0F9W9M6_9ZZZZ
MNLKELIQAAKAAITAGNLEEATKLYDQAKALKAIMELEPDEDDKDSEAMKALQKERDELKAKLDKAAMAPATNGAGTVIVTEDEADKANKRNPFKSMGEFLLAVKAATNNWMDPRLASLQSTDQVDEYGFSVAGAMGDDFVGSLKAAQTGTKSFKAAPTGLGESMPQYGGILVGTEQPTSILSRVYDSSFLLSRVAMDPIGPNFNSITYHVEAESSRATGSRRGGVQFYWLSENQAPTPSRPKFENMDLKLKKAGALVYVTEEQLQDSTALESYVMRIMPEELRWGVEDSILNGTGSGMPAGIEGSNAIITQAKETGQAADTVVYENLVYMWSRLWPRSKPNAIWLISQDVEPQLMLMTLDVGTGGVPVYTPPGGATAAPYGNIFGRPVAVHESCDNVGDVGDIQLLDLGEYQMIEKGGITSASSIHVRFLEGETAYRFIWRVDGQPIWRAPLTPANGGNTVSAYVNLAERA